MSLMTTPFSHADTGLTRFPPNVEQVTVERGPTVTWLVARRNDEVLRFPLTEDDRRHLAALLLGDLKAGTERGAP